MRIIPGTVNDACASRHIYCCDADIVDCGLEMASTMQTADCLCELSLIVDLTNHLNTLNLKLQKPGQTISQLCSHVDSFRRRLVVYQNHLLLEEKKFFFFPSCRVIFEEFGNECDFDNHLHVLQSVIDQFDERFTDFDSLRNDLILFENPSP